MMVSMMPKTANEPDTDMATGTYADGVFALTLKPAEGRVERRFRESYGLDTRLAHKGQLLAEMAAG